MSPKERKQVEFVLKVTERYKENGGFIWRDRGVFGQNRVRVSLADFILTEVGALLKQKAVASSKGDGR